MRDKYLTSQHNVTATPISHFRGDASKDTVIRGPRTDGIRALYYRPVASAWELISSERKGQVGRRPLVEKAFRMPDGSDAVFTVTGDAGTRAVACVALTPRQTAVVAEQYRPGPERVMTELPGGGVDDGESLAQAAARELAEETGYVPADLTYLGEMCYDAYFGGSRNYFLATGCERRQEQQLDPAEFVTVREVALANLVTLAMTGGMTDPGGVLLALPHLMGDPGVRQLFPRGWR